ncbi:MAG: TetR family transcriptional regulator [Alysiella sp.]|uniref:TetR family transcriptional regulator n=1 Tax=Alysiella sp. TaxID=1872483 RepID=UPI0026DDA4E5|nr:TetR family transcriptional regulator [Alysiella sp.]MDO4434387.1 TetR family transcriptional regulator [Alysiella sp.]
MAKAGVGADAVAAMCHAELSAWLDDVLTSLGIKQSSNEGVIVSRRLPKPTD